MLCPLRVKRTCSKKLVASTVFVEIAVAIKNMANKRRFRIGQIRYHEIGMLTKIIIRNTDTQPAYHVILRDERTRNYCSTYLGLTGVHGQGLGSHAMQRIVCGHCGSFLLCDKKGAEQRYWRK